MRYGLLLLLLTFLSLVVLSGCAKTSPPLEISYSAKLVIFTTRDGKPSILEGKIAQKGKSLRLEGITMGEYVVTIIRPDLNKTYLIYPYKKMYTEKALEPSKDYGVWMSAPQAGLKVERVKIGAERIEKHVTGIYKVTTTNEKTKEVRTVTYWEAQDLGGVPLRIELDLPGGKMIYQLQEIMPTAASDLFEVPQGYQKAL